MSQIIEWTDDSASSGWYRQNYFADTAEGVGKLELKCLWRVERLQNGDESLVKVDCIE